MRITSSDGTFFHFRLVSHIRWAFWVSEKDIDVSLYFITSGSDSTYEPFQVPIPEDPKSSVRLRHLKKGAIACCGVGSINSGTSLLLANSWFPEITDFSLF